MTLLDQVQQQFVQRFNTQPVFLFSPGRVNLIGEHTDYNQGFVLPAAIDQGVVFAIASNHTQQVNLRSVDLDQSLTVNLGHLPSDIPGWSRYPLGVVDQMLKRQQPIQGFDVVYSSDLPSGAGLSSSAAIECGIAYGLQHIFDLKLTKPELARLAQQAENTFVGVQCGIMDQFASLMGRKDHVFKLDCRDLDYDYLPLSMTHHELLLFNTQVKHNLADSEYNDRRAECEQGVRLINTLRGTHYLSLRDISLDELQACRAQLDPVVYKRCDYVIREIARVQAASTALQQQDLSSFGQLMFETHAGLQHDYEVSCTELDFLVDQARQHSGILGARMMGGGFGGCTINLVEKAKTSSVIDQIASAYDETFQRELPVYVAAASDGTHLLDT